MPDEDVLTAVEWPDDVWAGYSGTGVYADHAKAAEEEAPGLDSSAKSIDTAEHDVSVPSDDDEDD